MINNKWSAALVLSMVASAAGAQSYQAELEGAFERLTSDWPFDMDTKDVSGRWYFESVDTANLPLAEAAFLQRSSSVSLAYQDRDIIVGTATSDDDGNLIPRQFKGSWKILSGKVNYYVPNTILYLEADYRYGKSASRSGPSFTDWGAALGIAPMAGLLILTRYSDDIDYRFNVETQYVTQLSGERALRLEASYYDWEWRDRISIGGDFYFDRTWSVGSWLETSSDTGVRLNTTDNGVGLRSRKFITDNFSVAGEAFKYGSNRRYGLNASLRF